MMTEKQTQQIAEVLAILKDVKGGKPVTVAVTDPHELLQLIEGYHNLCIYFLQSISASNGQTPDQILTEIAQLLLGEHSG